MRQDGRRREETSYYNMSDVGKICISACNPLRVGTKERQLTKETIKQLEIVGFPPYLHTVVQLFVCSCICTRVHWANCSVEER